VARRHADDQPLDLAFGEKATLPGERIEMPVRLKRRTRIQLGMRFLEAHVEVCPHCEWQANG